jgi:hypothetical protein
MTLVPVLMKLELRQEGVNSPVPKTQVVLSLQGQTMLELMTRVVPSLQVAQSLLDDQKIQVLIGLVQMKQELLKKQVGQMRQALKKPAVPKMQEVLGLMKPELTMQEDSNLPVPRTQVAQSLQVVPSSLEQKIQEVPRMLVLLRTQVDERKPGQTMQELQNLLGNQKTLVPMQLDQTKQVPLKKQVCQIRLVLKSLDLLKKQED